MPGDAEETQVQEFASDDESKIEVAQEYNETTGEEELKKIHMQLYGGGVSARSSFFNVLFRRRGSVLVKVFFVSLFSSLVAFVLVVMSQMMPDLWLLPEMRHPFTVQVFGMILSFVIVARTNVAVSRYFSGVTHVHSMSTRWVDSFTSLMGFLRASYDLHAAGSAKQEACVALGLGMLHWGSLAHALAINSLQSTQLGIDEKIWQSRVTTLEPPENLTLDSTTTGKSNRRSSRIGSMHGVKEGSRAGMQRAAMNANRRVSVSPGGVAVVKQNTSKEGRRLGRLGVFGKISAEELARLHGATDKVAIILMWMEEAVSRAQVQGIILVAPPILSRVYAELGNGLMGFNSAYRISLVPFPFCFSQMIGWCLVVFVFICPMVAYVFTGGEILTSMLTFCSMMGFWGVNRIAIELEQPFGTEVNHLPMAELHHAFVEALGEMHQHPMPEYRWDWDLGVQGTLPQLKRNLLKKQ